jgi:hypothetical protein
MTYLVAMTEVIYDEEYIIKEMLETGEYGINAYPISHEAMVEFVKDREWQIDHSLFLTKYDIPVIITIKDEEGNYVLFAQNKFEVK